MAAEDDAHGVLVGVGDGGDVETELEPGAPPRHPHDAVAVDLLRQLLAVAGRCDGDAAVRMEVVDVGGVDEAVHRRVDRRCGAALAVEAEVEGGDHVVLSLLAWVDVDESAEPVEAQHGETARRSACRDRRPSP